MIERTEEATIADHPAQKEASHTGGSLVAVRALHGEEVKHIRGFATVCFALCVVGTAFQPFMPGAMDGVRIAFIVAVVVVAAVSAWILLVTRDERRYTRTVYRIYGLTCCAAAIPMVLYGGVGGTVSTILVLGVGFFGRGLDQRFSKTIAIVMALMYGTLATLVVAKVIPDTGVFSIGHVPLAGQIFLIFMVPAVFLAALWHASVSRQATVEAIEQLDAAMRLAQQRQAQLDEAHQNLDAAQRAGGKLGRFSGQTVGQWSLGEVIGRGAMGDVYEGRHVSTGEAIALKLLQSERDKSDELRRFLREAEVTVKLRSPHIVRVHETGAAADGTPYIAMELLRGNDLGRLVRNRALPFLEVLRLVEQVARGLDHAHAAGVVHRDIKPQNLFHAETPEGHLWKILDFGISKPVGSQGTLTQGAVLGTPGYMSPEQAQGREADARADVFSLAAVTYRALCGRPPFTGPDIPQVLYAIVYAQPQLPTALVRGVPLHVDQVVMKGLAKRPEDRFASAGELSAALARWS